MKKLFIISISIFCSSALFSQNWNIINKLSPDYHYSLPGNPNMLDTLNVRMAYFKMDSTIVFQVMEFKDTPLDTANAIFDNNLVQTNNDTLMALAQTVSATSNSSITSFQNINSFEGYKGLEITTNRSLGQSGEILISYTRFFYNIHTLLYFTISAKQNDISLLNSNKNIFFNSIFL
jgi:hypothetical protein